MGDAGRSARSKREHANAGGLLPAVSIVLLVWAGLIAWKVDCLARPPYEDQSIALYAEAEYLSRTGFDYVGLYREPHFMFGGLHRSYMISALPTILAVAMRLAKPANVIWVSHVLTLGCAATGLFGLYGVLRRRFSGLLAAICLAAFATMPAVQVQLEMIGMEIPMLVPLAVCLWALESDRWGWALGMSFVAFLVKASGALVTAALVLHIVCQAARMALSGGRGAWKGSLGWIAGGAALFGIEFLMMRWSGDPVIDGTQFNFHWPAILSPWAAYRWCPDIAFVILAGVASFGLWAWLSLRRQKLAGGGGALGESGWRSWAQAGAGWALGERTPLVALVLAAGTIYGMTGFVFGPRYSILAILGGWLLLCESWYRLLPERRIFLAASCMAAALFNLGNSHGRWLPPLPVAVEETSRATSLWHARQCVFSERSLAYRRDQDSLVRVARLLEQQHGEATILAEPFQFACLTRPKLGYVERALPHARSVSQFADGLKALHRHLSELRESPHISGRELIVVWSRQARAYLPTPTLPGSVIFDDRQIPPLVAYRLSGDTLRTMGDAAEKWFVRDSWSSRAWPAQRAWDRAQYLAETGRTAMATAEISWAGSKAAECPEGLRLALASAADSVNEARSWIGASGTGWQTQPPEEASMSAAASTSAGETNRVPSGGGDFAVRQVAAARLLPPLRADAAYRCQVWARSERASGGILRVAAVGAGPERFEARQEVALTTEWQPVAVDYRPERNTREAMFQIWATDAGASLELRDFEVSCRP